MITREGILIPYKILKLNLELTCKAFDLGVDLEKYWKTLPDLNDIYDVTEAAVLVGDWVDKVMEEAAGEIKKALERKNKSDHPRSNFKEKYLWPSCQIFSRTLFTKMCDASRNVVSFPYSEVFLDVIARELKKFFENLEENGSISFPD